MKSKSGNAAIALAMLTVGTGIIVGHFSKTIQYVKTLKRMDRQQESHSNNAEVAYLLSDLFKVKNGGTLPFYYPDPYPNDLKKSPVVLNVSGEFPPFVNTTESVCSRVLCINLPKGDLVSDLAFTTLLYDSNSALLKDPGHSRNALVDFISYTIEPPLPNSSISPKPNLIKSIVAEIRTPYLAPGSRAVQNATNRIEIALDPLPPPTCTLTRLGSEVVNAGQTVTLTLETRGIVGDITIQGINGSTSAISIPMPKDQTIKTLDPKKDAFAVGSFNLTAPAGFVGNWSVVAKVGNLDPSKPASECSTDPIAMSTVPRPICTLSAIPAQVATGETSRVTMICEENRNITELWFGQKNLSPLLVIGTPFLDADGKTKQKYQTATALGVNDTSRTFVGYAKGPGGTSIPAEMTIAKYAQCPFVANPQYSIRMTAVDGYSHLIKNSDEILSKTLLARYPCTHGSTRGGRVARCGPYTLNYATWSHPQLIYTRYADAERWEMTNGNITDMRANNNLPFQNPCGSSNICMAGTKATFALYKDAALNQVYFNGNNFENYRNLKVEFGPRTDPNCRLLRSVSRTAGCFREGTLILNGNKKYVPIETLGYGDWVWNPLRKRAQRIKKVVRGPEKKPLVRLVTSAGILDVTTKHPFFSRNGLVTAEEIQKEKAEFLRIGSASLQSVTTVSIGKTENVWNVELEGGEDAKDHAVLANGVITGDLYMQEKAERDRSGKKNILARRVPE